MGNAGSVWAGSAAEGADSEKLMAQLNRIACSEMWQSSEEDLRRLESPEYCSEIIGLTKDALLTHIQEQSKTEKKFLLELEAQLGPGNDSASAQMQLCEELAYKYVLVYKIYQLIRSAVGHEPIVQDLCRKLTPKAKKFGGGYCEERLQALALAARDTQPGSQTATISSKVCHLPSAKAKGRLEWAKRLDSLFEKMKTGSYNTKAHAAQIRRLDLRIGRQKLTSMPDQEHPAKFAEIKPLDRNLGLMSKAACMEPTVERGTTRYQHPNALYKLQIGEGVFLDEYRQHEQKIRAVIRSAAAKLSAFLRSMFTGLNDRKGVVTLAPGLTMDKLHAIAANVRDEVVNMFIACDTQYVEAVNTFARVVASEAYAGTATKNRSDANALYPAWERHGPDPYVAGKRLKTYESEFTNIPKQEVKETAASLAMQEPLVQPYHQQAPRGYGESTTGTPEWYDYFGTGAMPSRGYPSETQGRDDYWGFTSGAQDRYRSTDAASALREASHDAMTPTVGRYGEADGSE